MKKLLHSVFIFLVACSTPSYSKAESPLKALAEIQPAMESEIAAQHAAGVVTLVMRDGKPIHHAAAGMADIERKIPMKTDSVFWIASMTKSMSATVIMTLVDEGKLSLDEPASKWLPDLAKVKLANGELPSRPITLRDLMSHTSGLAFPPRKADEGSHSLKSYTALLVKAPLAFEPGSAYEYGFGLTVAGRIAEIVSQKPFDVLMQERILTPLGMNDTAFHPDDRLRARIARTYKTDDESEKLVRGHNPFVTLDTFERRMTEPSGGLFSTALDMSKFYQMILDGGVLAGKQIVSEKSIEEMTRPHQAGGKTLTYGLGWQCSQPNKPAIPGYSSNSFGHGGAFGTHGWIDAEQKIVAVYMVQNVHVKSGNARNVFHSKITGVSASSRNEN
jgi:CubicO group peptidase (beta-lactamase class C family)